jgi:hypothetical protein
MRVRYIVKKDEGVVICLGQGTALDAMKDLGIFNYKEPDFDLVFSLPECIISDEYKGVARLCDGDTWDEKFGKEIAYQKMKKKYLRAKIKAVGRAVEHFAKEYQEALRVHKNLRAEEEVCMKALQEFE